MDESQALLRMRAKQTECINSESNMHFYDGSNCKGTIVNKMQANTVLITKLR